jgi:hypothetical protein
VTRVYEHYRHLGKTIDTLETPPKERHARHCTGADEEAVLLGIQKLVQGRSSAAFAGSLTRVALGGRRRGSVRPMPLAATPTIMPLVQPHKSRGGVDISFEAERCRGLEHMYAQVNVRRGRLSGRPPCTRPPCTLTSPSCTFRESRPNGRGNKSTRSMRNTANTAAIGTCEARGSEASESRRGGGMAARRSLANSRRGGALTPMEADSERYRTLQPQPHRHEQEPERHAEGVRQEEESGDASSEETADATIPAITGDASIPWITELPTYTRQREEEGVRGGASMWGVCDEGASEAETHTYKLIDTERDGDGMEEVQRGARASQLLRGARASERCQSASHTCHTREPACKVDRQVQGQWSGEEVSGAGDESREVSAAADKQSSEHSEATQKGKGSMEAFKWVKGGAEEQVGVDGTGEEEEDMYMLRTRMAQSLVSLSHSHSLNINCIS